jgi:Vitamin B12 dependent methionine synthase, activation domain
MNEIVEFERGNILPDTSAVLLSQGITSEVEIEDSIKTILDDAMGLFEELVSPVGTIKSLSVLEFRDIYRGEGINEKKNPVLDIYPQADKLALFAITLGEKISKQINDLFQINDFAIASMLDSAASEGADLAAEILEHKFKDYMIHTGDLKDHSAVLRYSPGYCGWHISGQKKLFGYLEPDKIGISLRESFLMEPLKSISGVIIAAPKSAHKFENDYPCCDKCDTMSCQDRMQGL